LKVVVVVLQIMIIFHLYVFSMGQTLAVVLLQLLRWRCVECVIHHERDVREEQHPYVLREQAITE